MREQVEVLEDEADPAAQPVEVGALSFPWTDMPSKRMSPDWISSSRLMVRIRVDLPEPDGPQTTTTSPRATSAFTSTSAGTPP